jgi:putative FmdB family regulatory protein
MPIYEFKCQSCGEVTESLQKTTDPYPTQCPICKTGRLEKMMSATGFTLKGEGWYVTDFKNKPTSATTPPAAPSTPPSTPLQSVPEKR